MVCATQRVRSHLSLISISLARLRFTGLLNDHPFDPLPRLGNDNEYENQDAQLEQPRPLPRLPSIRLGGGGFVDFRNRGNPDTFNRHNILNGNAQAMHRREIELDNERFPARLQEHYDDVLAGQDLSYPTLLGGVREAIGQVMNTFGWGNAVNAYLRSRVPRARATAQPVSALQNLNFPEEEPKYRDSFTHPGKMPSGFTFDFGPVQPDAVSSGESDDDDAYNPLFDEHESEAARRKREKWRRKKGKGKAPVQTPAPGVAQKLLQTVCVHCGDPLMVDGNEDQKLYGLQCGHVLDGKCIWKIGVPPPPVPLPFISFADAQGKGKEKQETVNSADPSFKFTFSLPAKPSLKRDEEAGPTSSQYQEVDNPMPLYIPEDMRSRLRSRRELVPTPSASKRRRHIHQSGDNIDGVDDNLPSSDVPTTPSLNLSDPFFPVLNNPPTSAATGSRGTRRTQKVPVRSIRRGKDPNRLIRSVRNTKGRLREELYEWNCPVQDCGRPHLSVRLDVEGAKWRCDDAHGATGMFL
jgi:hypothetical protein